MRKYYTVFDRTKNAIGFALALTNNSTIIDDIQNPYEDSFNDEIIDEILQMSKGKNQVEEKTIEYVLSKSTKKQKALT